MEIHKHPHHVTHKKKWFEYALEFLMIFLAVFLGFVAENLREKSVEKERENQYIKSFAEDLTADTVYLRGKYQYYSDKIREMDSLIISLNNADRFRNANDIYYFCLRIMRNTPFRTNDRTISQLRNAGGMRLISNKAISDSIVSYYSSVESMISHDNIRANIIYNYFAVASDEILDGNASGKLIDTSNLAEVLRPTDSLTIKTTDNKSINKLIQITQRLKYITIALQANMIKLNNKATGVLRFLQS